MANEFTAWLVGPQATAIFVALVTLLVGLLLTERKRHQNALEQQRVKYEQDLSQVRLKLQHEIEQQARAHAHELEKARLQHELDGAARRHEWEREVGLDLGEEFRDFTPRLLQPGDPIAAGELMLALDKRLGRYVNDLPPRLSWYMTDYSAYSQELIAGWAQTCESATNEELAFPFMTGLLLLWLPARSVVEGWCSTGVVPDLEARRALWDEYVKRITAAGIQPLRSKPEEPVSRQG